MKLYQIADCPFAWRVRIALEEKRLPFETVFFESKRPPELEALSEDAKSPTLVDGDVKLWESLVINEYLEDRYPEPPLLPADPAGRAAVRVAVAVLERKLMPPFSGLMRELVFTPAEKRDPNAVARARTAWREAQALFDGKLDGRGFLAGDELSLADIVLFTPIATSRRLAGEELPAGLDHLRAWFDRLAARPAMRPASASPSRG